MPQALVGLLHQNSLESDFAHHNVDTFSEALQPFLQVEVVGLELVVQAWIVHSLLEVEQSGIFGNLAFHIS